MKPVKLPKVGLLQYRDSIFLDEVRYSNSCGTLRLTGDISTATDDNEFIPYELVFKRVLYFQSIELDFYEENKLIASIMQVEDSALLNTLQQKGNTKLTPQHSHYIVATYDEVFEIVAQHDFAFSVKGVLTY